jgi:hypothetical protein
MGTRGSVAASIKASKSPRQRLRRRRGLFAFRLEIALRIACIQMEPQIGEKAENVARSVAFIEEAADGGAELVVLPELANTGYVFESLE